MAAEAAHAGDGGNGLGASLRQFLRMVKFEHTIFGLPFVCFGGVLAAAGLPTPAQIFWILMAAVGARNFAMTLNRFADRDIDPKNPRTKDRAEFQGLLHSVRIWVLMGVFGGLFIYSAWMLNPLAFALSFVVAGVVILYSYSKRFTSFTHFFLGFVLGAAPAGAWVAVRGDLTMVPVLLFAGVTLWVGGFDIIYACLDVDFDRSENLFSIPRLLGVRGGLVLSAAMHIGTVGCFYFAGVLAGLGALYWLGLAAATGLLVWEHWVVRPGDLSRVNLSFFNINAWVSVIVSAGGDRRRVPHLGIAPVLPVRIERDDVQAMFSDIAPTYDRLNRLLSFGIDRIWRRAAIKSLLNDLQFGKTARILDLATGTGDVALGIAGRIPKSQKLRLVGADIAFPMLARALPKSQERRVPLDCLQADAMELPFQDVSFDGAIIAFGLRNLSDREKGLREMARVIRPGGRLVVLEFGQPKGIFGALYYFYFRYVLPPVGRLVSGHPTAYEYLPSTVYEFPNPERLSAMMQEAGFPGVTNRALTGGIVQIHIGDRSPAV